MICISTFYTRSMIIEMSCKIYVLLYKPLHLTVGSFVHAKNDQTRYRCGILYIMRYTYVHIHITIQSHQKRAQLAPKPPKCVYTHKSLRCALVLTGLVINTAAIAVYFLLYHIIIIAIDHVLLAKMFAWSCMIVCFEWNGIFQISRCLARNPFLYVYKIIKCRQVQRLLTAAYIIFYGRYISLKLSRYYILNIILSIFPEFFRIRIKIKDVFY